MKPGHINLNERFKRVALNTLMMNVCIYLEGVVPGKQLLVDVSNTKQLIVDYWKGKAEHSDIHIYGL
jgi:hypothetical protein